MDRGLAQVEKYLVDNKLSTASDVAAIASKLTSYQFYQTCVEKMNNMLVEVCHKTDYPQGSKVKTIQC